MNPLLVTIFLGSMTVTSYRSVPNQTDNSPYYTSIGDRTSEKGIAISQDMLCGACRRLHKRCKEPNYSKKLHYGDLLHVEDVGFRFVNDVMNKRYKNRLDVWVKSYKAEQSFHAKFKYRKLNITKVVEINASEHCAIHKRRFLGNTFDH